MWRRLLVAGVVLSVAGCGRATSVSTSSEDADRPAATQPTTEPSVAEPSASDLRVTFCGLDVGTPDAVELPTAPMNDATNAALDEAVTSDMEDLFNSYTWSVGSQDETRIVLFGRANDDEVATEGPYFSAELIYYDSQWVVGGLGACDFIVGADGYSYARLVLNPAIEPDPASTELHVWNHQPDDRSCP